MLCCVCCPSPPSLVRHLLPLFMSMALSSRWIVSQPRVSSLAFSLVLLALSFNLSASLPLSPSLSLSLSLSLSISLCLSLPPRHGALLCGCAFDGAGSSFRPWFVVPPAAAPARPLDFCALSLSSPFLPLSLSLSLLLSVSLCLPACLPPSLPPSLPLPPSDTTSTHVGSRRVGFDTRSFFPDRQATRVLPLRARPLSLQVRRHTGTG